MQIKKSVQSFKHWDHSKQDILPIIAAQTFLITDPLPWDRQRNIISRVIQLDLLYNKNGKNSVPEFATKIHCKSLLRTIENKY